MGPSGKELDIVSVYPPRQSLVTDSAHSRTEEQRRSAQPPVAPTTMELGVGVGVGGKGREGGRLGMIRRSASLPRKSISLTAQHQPGTVASWRPV